MDALLYCCCGLDVHKEFIEACILRGEDNTPEIIRHKFSTQARGLQELLKWLSDHDCYSVAMESTGVYWFRIFDTIQSGMAYKEQVFVVNSYHMRNVPGRKSDVKDAEWIATLLRHGLLKNSFIPEQEIRDLREYTRLKRTMVQEQSRYKNRIEKYLQSHGFKFSSVMSDVFCKTGMKLLNVLSETGKLDPLDVEANCKKLRKHTTEEIVAAVCGKLRNPEQCLLQHLLRILDSCSEQIQSLQKDILNLSTQFQEELELIQTIPGINEESAIEIIAETSSKPQEYFPSAGHFCKWAGLIPRNDGSAQKVKSRRTLHGNPRLKSILCQVAWVSVYARNSVFHDWFWSHQKSLGQKKAIIAVSRRLLSLIYLILQRKTPYIYPV